MQVASDIALLLRTFAFQRSFSQEAKGGGPESNMRLLLAMIALGRYFASCCAAEELQVHAGSCSCVLTVSIIGLQALVKQIYASNIQETLVRSCCRFAFDMLWLSTRGMPCHFSVFQ